MIRAALVGGSGYGASELLGSAAIPSPPRSDSPPETPEPPEPPPPGKASLPSSQTPLDLDGLTHTRLHEAILHDYHRRVGCRIRAEDLADRLDTSDERMDLLLEEFHAAGLIDRRAEGDFWRLLDRERWEKVEDWAKTS